MKMKILAVLIVSLFCFTGCAANLAQFDNWFNTNKDSLQTSVYLTTDLALRGNVKEAAVVTKVINQVRSKIADGSLVSADAVQNYITLQLGNLNLTPADQLIMSGLLSKLQAKIVDTFTILNLKTPAKQLVEINIILGWVLDISTRIK